MRRSSRRRSSASEVITLAPRSRAATATEAPTMSALPAAPHRIATVERIDLAEQTV